MTYPAPAPTGRPFTFYTPHQDDETLFAGQIIAHHAMAGREVHIVLATDGSTTGVRDMVNGVRVSGWWGGYHYPYSEGYEDLAPLSAADMAAARDRELAAAAGELGVRPANLHLRQDVRVTNLTAADAVDLIIEYANLLPGTGHYAMHWEDTDPNHAALGAALRDLYLSGDPRFSDARWVVRYSQQATLGEPYVISDPTTSDNAKFMAKKAALAYRSWAPRQGLFAVGYHSVSSQFAYVESGAPNYIVKTA